MPAPLSATSLLERLFRRLPIIGFAIDCMEQERYDRLAVLGLTLLMAAVLAVLVWGFPAFILIMYVAVALAGVFILAATRG